MSVAQSKIAYRRLRAPFASGQSLVDPEVSSVGQLIAENRTGWNQATTELFGQPLRHLAIEARAELIEKATAYTGQYRDVENYEADGNCQLILSGHQPQLFHAGVWFKNFLIHRLAMEQKAISINLVIDNDLCRSPSLRVPTGTAQNPSSEAIAYDATVSPIPYEERTIQDENLFSDFGQRAADSIGELVHDPIIKELWPLATAVAKRTNNLGECLSQARHGLEATWGLRTLELPLGAAVESDAFRLFAAQVLLHIDDFGKAYNDRIEEYRRVNKIRSHSHPVPLLSRPSGPQGDWFEAPFWIWNSEQPERRAVEVQLHGNHFIIRPAGTSNELRLDIHSSSSVQDVTAAFAKLREQGWKLRPRALMTTMYARLFLSDLFVHGIGGAKYDQLTDALVGDWFSMAPPAFLTATATLKLPIARAPIEQDDVRQIEGLIRELHYHPDCSEPDVVHIDVEKFEELVNQKKKLLRAIPPKRQKKNWNNEIQSLNEQLREYVSRSIETLAKERERLVSELRRDSLLSSREISFCLFPRKSLRQSLLEISCRAS
ncbi:MAG: hypothetical protein AAF497_04280 [Planctomycetota bacterium]